jgi:hypothetical protein
MRKEEERNNSNMLFRKRGGGEHPKQLIYTYTPTHRVPTVWVLLSLLSPPQVNHEVYHEVYNIWVMEHIQAFHTIAHIHCPYQWCYQRYTNPHTIQHDRGLFHTLFI